VEDVLLGLANLLVIVAGDADAHLTASNGEWGWRADGSFVHTLPGVHPITPLGSTINQTRSVPLLLSVSNSAAISNMVIDANVRGTNAHIFHAAANGTMLQLEFAKGSPGTLDQIRLGTISNQLTSFRFTPQIGISNFIPRIGFRLGSNACAAFQWMGLSGEGGQAQEFRALKSRRAVEYYNLTGKATQHYLRVDAVDGASTNNACTLFGPFDVPTGAVHCVVLQDWPRVRQVRSELDLDGDGIPDQVTMVTGTEIDSDGDGMPDAWETLHQLNPFSANCDDGPNADPDHDGISNLGEYLSDTDPHDPASVLRLNASRLSGNQVRLSWHAVPGRRYEILYANSFEYVFQPVPGAGFPRVATGTEEHFDDTLTNAVTRTRFYRLRLVP
jgi:hypothetical protein